MREWSSNTKIGEVFHPARSIWAGKKAPATGKQGGMTMFWFLFSVISAILAACVPVMSHMSTFGGADDEL